MRKHILGKEPIEKFKSYLVQNEKSRATIEKYIRDVRAFAKFVGGNAVTKETVIAYKDKLISDNYAVRSINSMLASINSLLSFLGWTECRVKTIRLQRQIYCPEEKELTKAEYLRLVNTAKHKGNERLHFIIQTICGVGIRVSELPFKAVKKSKALVSLKRKTCSVFIVKDLQKRLLRYAAQASLRTAP